MVSICIPTYNQPQYVDRLIRSIKEQTYADYEIIISDDSTDNDIYNLVHNKYAELGIKYEKNNKTLGAVRNCNKAIKRASGDLIKVMHQDDWFAEKEALEKMVSVISQNEKITLYSCNCYHVGDSFTYKRDFPISRLLEINSNPMSLYMGNWIGAPSVTIFRNNGVVQDDKLRWLVDLDLYITIMQGGGLFAFTDEPLVCIGLHNNQETVSCVNNKKLIRSEYQYLYKKYKLYKLSAKYTFRMLGCILSGKD